MDCFILGFVLILRTDAPEDPSYLLALPSRPGFLNVALILDPLQNLKEKPRVLDFTLGNAD